MPDQSNAGRASALPDHGSPEWWAQRIVLAELVVTPPAAGDTIAYPGSSCRSRRTRSSRRSPALEAVGLVTRAGDVVRATEVAKYVEHLWPIRP